MNFETSRNLAIEKLNRFIDQNLSEYSRLRNFDFGPNKRSNISCLSPYITHGIITELEVIKKSLNKFSFSKNESIFRSFFAGGEFFSNFRPQREISHNICKVRTLL